MAEYDNRLRFVLFRNKNKKTDNHPDWTGTFTDKNGVEHYMDGWTTAPKSGGEKFLSGKVKEKQASSEIAQKRPALEDDLPF